MIYAKTFKFILIFYISTSKYFQKWLQETKIAVYKISFLDGKGLSLLNSMH